jgi:excisionase family DNA binding protein
MTEPKEPVPIFVSIADAATMLTITPWTIRQLVARGQLRARKLGRRTVVEAKSLQTYAAALPPAKLARVRAAVR